MRKRTKKIKGWEPGNGIVGFFMGGKFWSVTPGDENANYALEKDMLLASCLATGQLLELRPVADAKA